MLQKEIIGKSLECISQIYKTPDRKGFVFKYGLKIQNVSCVIFLGEKNKIRIWVLPLIEGVRDL